MEESSAASDIPDLLEFLRPPVKKVYGARLYKVDSELEFHPKLYGHHMRHYPIRLKSQSSTSMILQKTTKIVKNTTLKSCGGGLTRSIRPTECYDTFNSDHKEILQVTVIPKTKRTHEKEVLEPYERSLTKPIIQVTVLPSPFKEKKRKHGRHIQTTTSNQESSIKSNLFVVVSRGKKEKLYEVKASGSTADIKRLRKNYTKYDEIDPQQLSQYKTLIKSLNMEKKKRKGKTETPGKRKEYKVETLVNSRKKTSQKNKYEMESVIKDASGGIDGNVGKNRLQIMGKLGVTADDKYILDCSATIDGQPIATRCGELEQLFTTENVECADESESDASELKIERINCDCQTKTGSYQDFSVQTDKVQTSPTGQKLLKSNGSRSTQFDVIVNQIKQSNKLCQCYESISEAKILSAECPPSPVKETRPCGNALIVISVYPTDNKCVLIKEENNSSLVRDIIQTALQKESTIVDSVQIDKTNSKEKIQDILIQDSADDRFESCKCKIVRDQSPNEKYTDSKRQEIVPKIKPKRDKSPASKVSISKSSNEPSDKAKSTKKSLRTSSPKRDKSSEPKSPRSKSPTRFTRNIAELESTRNKNPSPQGQRKEISPPLKVIKSVKPEASSKLKKDINGKRNKATLHMMDPFTSSSGYNSLAATRRRNISPDNKKGKKITNSTIVHSDKNHPKEELKNSNKNADKVNVNLRDDKKDNRNIVTLPNEAGVNIPSWQMNSNYKVNEPTFGLSDNGYSNVSVNIHSKNEHYDLIFHQNGSSTDVIVKKCNNNLRKNNSLSLRNHCAEAESTYDQNCPARDEINSKRSISDTDVASIQATKGTGLSLANVRDSLELCHQHEKQSSLRVSHQNHVTNCSRSAYDGATKHFRGDNCSITDPFERDREIQELLGVTKRQFSCLQSRERTGFGIWNEYEIQYCVLPQRLRKATPSKIQKQKPHEATNEEYLQGSDYKTGCSKTVNTYKSIVITPNKSKAEGDIIMRTPISLSIKDYFRVKKTLRGKVSKNIIKQQRQKRLRKKSARHLKTVTDSTKANRRDQVTQIEESDKVLVGSFEELVPVATSPPHINNVDFKEDTREKTDLHQQKAVIVFNPSTVKEENPCENAEQVTQNALSALLFGYAFLHRVMASKQQPPLRMASNVGHYNIFRNNIQETASNQNLEETKENNRDTCLNEEKPVSVRMLFKGSNRKRCHTPNLGASAFSLCAETGSNSIKFNEQAPSKTKQKKPFLKRLVSCMLRSSKAAPPAADEARNIAKSVMNSSTCDSYFINTSLGPMEISSSIYDTTASFYSSHTVLPTLDRGPKKSFFGSMLGLLR